MAVALLEKMAVALPEKLMCNANRNVLNELQMVNKVFHELDYINEQKKKEILKKLLQELNRSDTSDSLEYTQISS